MVSGRGTLQQSILEPPAASSAFWFMLQKEKQNKGRFLWVHLPSQHCWLTSVPGHQLIWTAAVMHFRLTVNVNKSYQAAQVLGYHWLGKVGDDFASLWIWRSQDPHWLNLYIHNFAHMVLLGWKHKFFSLPKMPGWQNPSFFRLWCGVLVIHGGVQWIVPGGGLLRRTGQQRCIVTIF